jgi:hypothetical protein
LSHLSFLAPAAARMTGSPAINRGTGAAARSRRP